MKGRPRKSRRPLSFILRDMYERLLWETASLKECEEELKELRPSYLKYCHLQEMEDACIDSIRAIYALIGDKIDWDALPSDTKRWVICCTSMARKKEI